MKGKRPSLGTYRAPSVSVLGLDNRLVNRGCLQSVQLMRHDPLTGVVIIDAAVGSLGQDDVVPPSGLLVSLVHLQG